MSAVTAACSVLLLAGLCACLWARPPAQLTAPVTSRRPEIARVGQGGDGSPSPYSRKLLQESPSGATQQPPENVTVINYNAPATGVVVASVVGGLGGLTLVLAGALLIASGAINRWTWCGWLWRLGGTPGAKGKAGQAQSPSTRSISPRTTRRAHSFSTLAIPSTKTLASTLDTAPRSTSETYGLLRAERAADAPTAYATYTTGPRTSPATQGGVEELEGPNSPLHMLSADLGWRECLIDPCKVQILRRASGQPWRLGGGSFGQVYKALYDDVQVVAVKVLPGLSDPRQLQAFLREGQILRGCRDKNIVQFVGVALDPESDQAMLVTEFMDAGDLWRALHWRDQQGRRVFGWHQRGKKAALDAARGLHYLHQHHIIHFDLKSANILLDRSGTAKLADVGLAKVSTKNYFSAVKTMGTFAWTAPEVLTGQRCDEKADIFSWGVVLWEIITGETPTRGTMRTIEVPEECPPEIRDLCDKCMSADPRERPSAKQIVKVLEVAVGGVGRQLTIKGTPPWLASPKTSGPSGPQDWPAVKRPGSAQAQLEGASSATLEPETPFAAHENEAKPGSPEPEPSLDGRAALSRRSPARSPFGTPVQVQAGAGGGDRAGASGQEVQLVQLQPVQAAPEGGSAEVPSPGQLVRTAAAGGPGSPGDATVTRLSSPFETSTSPFEGGSTAMDAAPAAAAPAATPPWQQWRQGSNAAMLSPFAAFGGPSFSTRTSSEEEGGALATPAADGGAEERAVEQAGQKSKAAAVPVRQERQRKGSSVRFSLPPRTPSISSGALGPQRSSAAATQGQAAPSQQDQLPPPHPLSFAVPPPPRLPPPPPSQRPQ